MLGIFLVAMAVWLHSPAEGLAGVGLILLGMLNFRLPPFPSRGRFPKLVRRLIQAEVVWVNKPLTRRKAWEAVQLALGGLFMLGVLWWGSLPGLGLTLGGFVLLRVRRANREAGIDP
jgi:hypothetical protein